MDNRKKLIKFQLYSTIFAIVLGTILHFTYSWSENNTIIDFLVL